MGVAENLSVFYLGIAEQALKRLEKLKRRPTIKPGTDDVLKRSPHFQHAVVCVVFSAVAVEHAMAGLMLDRVMRSGPPYRRLLVSTLRRVRTIDQTLAFIRGATKIPAQLLKEIETLCQDRNRIVHLGLDMEMRPHPVPWGTPPEYPHIKIPRLREAIVTGAKGNFGVAQRAVRALEEAEKEDEWFPVPGYRNLKVTRKKKRVP